MMLLSPEALEMIAAYHALEHGYCRVPGCEPCGTRARITKKLSLWAAPKGEAVFDAVLALTVRMPPSPDTAPPRELATLAGYLHEAA